jgi:hypothetical protein
MLPRDRALVVDADRDLGEVVGDLGRNELRRALVRVDGRPTGLLSVTDVARVLEVLTAARARTPVVAGPEERFTRRRDAVLGS